MKYLPVLLLSLLPTALACGQGSDEFDLESDRVPGVDLETLLKRRAEGKPFPQTGDRRFDRLVEDLLRGEQDGLLKNLLSDPNRLDELRRQFGDQMPRDPQLTDQQKEDLRKKFADALRKDRPNPVVPPPPPPPIADPMIRDRPPIPQPNPNPAPGPQAAPWQAPPKATEPKSLLEEASTKKPSGPPKLDKRSQEILESLNRNFGGLKDSPVVKELVDDLLGGKWASDFKIEQTGLFQELFNGETGSPNSFLKGLDDSLGIGDWKLPNLRTPSLGLGDSLAGSEIGFSNDSYSSQGESSSGGSMQWFGLLLGVALLAAGAAWLLKKQELSDRFLRFKRLDRRLGPVDPGAVATNEELIRAYEFLAVQRLGSPATVWNHRLIAAQLHAKMPTHAETVDRLTHLYERARYAPASLRLSRADFNDAQVCLCSLSEGVG